MRIIAGMARGFRLLAPNDKTDIRPTSDKVREALFNIIDVRGLSLLDLCTGSGAVGCEALSRGANRIVMIEKERGVAKLADKNLSNLLKLIDAEPSAELKITTADSFIKSTSEIFDFIFCDPPYKDENSNELIKELLEGALLDENGLLIFESSTKRVAEMPTPDRIKKYGDTSLLFYYKSKGEK